MEGVPVIYATSQITPSFIISHGSGGPLGSARAVLVQDFSNSCSQTMTGPGVT